MKERIEAAKCESFLKCLRPFSPELTLRSVSCSSTRTRSSVQHWSNRQTHPRGRRRSARSSTDDYRRASHPWIASVENQQRGRSDERIGQEGLLVLQCISQLGLVASLCLCTRSASVRRASPLPSTSLPLPITHRPPNTLAYPSSPPTTRSDRTTLD